jgi:exodeoxyribonuclease V beta subunit
MTVFDLLDVPLEGSNLIEASAGTGKTHNIVGLFVRLIVEKELAARNILVVTYTIAATEELRDRIRRRLVEMEGALLKGESKDPFIVGLIRKIQRSDRTEAARRLLRAAIRDFDEAAIYTIHSFCYRMLQEHAFESGALFETELIPDEDAIKREFAQDFWRCHFYEAPLEFVAYSLSKNLSPDYYLDLLKQAYPNPTVALIPEVPPPDAMQMEAEIRLFHDLFFQLQDLWKKEKDIVTSLLRQPGLNGRLYGKKVDSLLNVLVEFFGAKRPLFPSPAVLEKITAKKIGENVNKGHLPPAHPLFDLADRLWTQAELLTSRFEEHLRYLRMEIVRQGRMELPRRKERRNILAYDDLLNDLYGALRTERGNRLAAEIRSRFQAVLIDEFQDTDPVQYAIFKSLFLSGEHVEQRPFFAIGDPKQAIYAFRGADIFAYIDAARSMNRTYTLKENWRSEPDLLQAVNTLFGAPQKPFLYDDIHYRSVTAADQPDRDLLLIDNRREPPFQWWLIPEETEENGNEATPPDASPAKGLAKTSLYPQVAASVASEVARLIRLGVEGRARIGDKALQAEDIAILVRTNREGSIMRETLIRWNIPHVVSSQESVFHSPEAEDVRRILIALAEPRNPALIRAALVTDIMGMTGDDIHALSLDEAGWEAILRRFHLYHGLWAGQGFIRMFRSFLENEHLPSGILKIVEGERRLTNLLHIGELLHQAATTDHLAMHDLIKWLSDQISSGETQPEDYELRLEREEKAVKVVTIHKSKGLEYPIVFCPFSWGSSGPRKNLDHVLYHDPSQSFAPVLDFGSADFADHRLRYEEESLAEDIRLLYVALTRARHRTYYIWGRMQHADSSASAYLFHQDSDMVKNDLAHSVRERYRRLSVEDFRRDVETIAGASGHTIRIQTLPVAGEKSYRPAMPTETLACRQFTGKIDATWKVASYTRLVASNYGDRDRSDDEHASQREMKPAPEEDSRERLPTASFALDMFGFPGGTKAGIFLHDILEKIDYRGSDPQTARDLVVEKLAQYGYDPHWAPAITSMMEKVTNTPFPLFNSEKCDLTLSQIRPEDRRNEVEFYFPLRRISRDDIVRIFREGAAMSTSGLSKVPQLHCIERLQFSPLQGYLKGFIDLLFCFGGRFYLVDWKSNHLGNQQQNYGQDELLRVMDEGYYFIQYHLYALALHQYLAFRVPEYRYEDHFGGVYYCFLRGMDQNSGSASGVFHDRPPLDLLEMMKAVLIRPPGL